jgi:biotin synthase
MIATLASLPEHPESCRSTCWCGRGHAARGQPGARPLEFVRTIAVARITMPRSVVRLSAGREDMSDETQALCFLAGANSIFETHADRALFATLGLNPMPAKAAEN